MFWGEKKMTGEIGGANKCSPVIGFDRAAFEQIVASRSPLRPDQIDKLLGGKVTADNKRLAWQLVNVPYKLQLTLWSVIQAFPEARVERIR